MCLTVALQHICSEAFSSIGGVFQPQLFCKHRLRFIGRKNRLSRDSEGRILTSKIKSAKSAKKVLAILDKTMNQPFFNKFHASAAYTSLTAMKRNGFSQHFGKRSWDSCVLSRLNDRVRTMILENQLGPREGANIFWSIVHLRDLGPIVLQLLGPLVEVLPGHAGSMNTQQLANCLWAAAHLHECAPAVVEIVPAIVSEVPAKAPEMVPQALSNCIWAAAKLQEVAPVLKMVPPIVTEILVNVKDMIPQALSNCLWAAAQLHEAEPSVLKMVPGIAKCLVANAEGLKPQELSNCMWAAARLHEAEPLVLQMLPVLAEQVPSKVKQMMPQALSNCFWAASELQEVEPLVLCMVPRMLPPLLAARSEMSPQELSNSLRAAPKLQDAVPVLQVMPAMLEQLKEFRCFQWECDEQIFYVDGGREDKNGCMARWRSVVMWRHREREIIYMLIHTDLKRCIFANDSNFKSVTCPQPPKPARLTQERQVHSMSEVRSKGGWPMVLGWVSSFGSLGWRIPQKILHLEAADGTDTKR